MFYIYFHNDFDGIVSAAIFSKFLYLKENIAFKDVSFRIVDYDLKNDWLNTPLEKPCAVLDFLYHPNADWWFDHHESTFIKTLEFYNLKYSEKKYWDTKYLSCPSLMLDHFNKYYFDISEQIRESYSQLIYWCDIIDGARYKSPKELYETKNVYLDINRTLSISSDINYYAQIINAIYMEKLRIFRKNKIFTDLLKQYTEIEKKTIKLISPLHVLEGVIVFIDQAKYDLPFQRYLGYYLFPEAFYRIGIYKKSDQFSISINYNIWKKEKNNIDLGNLCRKYGGGGRFDVGAILKNSYKEAIEIALLLKNNINLSFQEQYKLF
jgi:hypothetical protein